MSLVARYPLDCARTGAEPEWNQRGGEGRYTGAVVSCGAPRDTAGARFSGLNRLDIPSDPAFSIATTGALSIAVWIRPDALYFERTEGSGYVHIVAKGATPGEYEWALRMYSRDNLEGRANRISAYAFNPQGGPGAGSHFQDEITPGQWIHVVAVFDVAADLVQIWRDGIPRDADPLSGYAIKPVAGPGSVQVATRGGASYFKGAVADLRFYDHRLDAGEINDIREGR